MKIVNEYEQQNLFPPNILPLLIKLICNIRFDWSVQILVLTDDLIENVDKIKISSSLWLVIIICIYTSLYD